MADHEFYVVAVAGDHHLLGVAESVRHWLLAQNRFGSARRGGDGPGRMPGVPGADRHYVQPLGIQHGAGVAMVHRLDAEALIHLGHGAFFKVRQRHDIVAAGVDVAFDMAPRHAAAADDAGS